MADNPGILLMFQRKNLFTDLTVQCSDGSIYCHRAILSLCFPWKLPQDLDFILLPGVQLTIFKEKMEALYLTLNSGPISELLHGSCKHEHVDVVKHEVDDDSVQDALVQSSQDIHENSYEEDEQIPQGGEIKIKESGKKIEDCGSCEKCGKMFLSKVRLKKHWQSCSKYHHCAPCGKSFVGLTSLKRHMKSHCEFFSCDICQYKFKSQSILEEHINTHVEDPVNTLEKKGKEKTSVKTLTKENRYSCDYCEYKTNNNRNLKRHVEHLHLGIKYECKVCGELYASKSSLYMHSNVHTDDRPFICTECGDRFKWKKNLESHMDNKHSKISFSCTICFKLFKSQNSLDYHKKSHDVSLQFPCDVCGKRFFTKTKLKMHKNIHTGHKPYKCINEGCGRSFHSSDQLSHHKKICRVTKTQDDDGSLAVFSIVESSQIKSKT